MEEGKEIKRDSFSDLDLTPLEQSFVGNSPFMDGKRWEFSVFKKLLGEMRGNADLLNRLLTPPHFFSKKRSSDEINNEREQKKKLRGMFIVFDIERQVELARQMIEPCLKLPPIDENGRTSGQWMVGLEDSNGNEVVWEEKLGIEREFQDYFYLEKDPNSQGMILKIKND